MKAMSRLASQEPVGRQSWGEGWDARCYGGRVDRAEAAGSLLADRHRDEVTPDPVVSLLKFAESPRADDWTLRSALVRFAQPEPTRAGAVLELVRRCDAALRPLARTVERHTVLCSRTMSVDDVTRTAEGWEIAPPSHPYPDGRVVDLARLNNDRPEQADTIAEAYRRTAQLEPEEESALPLLGIVLALDVLAEALVEWTAAAPLGPPVEQVDHTCSSAYEQLEALGVPAETQPEGRRGRNRG